MVFVKKQIKVPSITKGNVAQFIPNSFRHRYFDQKISMHSKLHNLRGGGSNSRFNKYGRYILIFLGLTSQIKINLSLLLVKTLV